MGIIPIDTRQREHREATLRRLLEAQNRRDADAAVACFAHPRYELIGNQHVYDGAEDVRRYYAMTFGLFPDLAFEVIALHHSDEVVTAELWMSGSHLGSRPDFEATGKRFRCRMVALLQFAGDDLLGVRIYYDTGTIVRQLA
jgi:predicted ester cyclase